MTSALATALESGSVKPVFLAKFEFPGGHVRFWSGSGDKVYSSETYSGLGDLGRIDLPEENSAGAAGGITFSLSGIPSTNTSLALNENYQNYPCRLWISVLDASDDLIDPYQIFYGFMDVMEMSDDGVSASIQLKAEGFAYGVGPSNRRYTDEDQQRAFSGDKGLEFVASLPDKQIHWGIQGPKDQPVYDDYEEFDEEFDI